jgi:hypothetical protein
MHLVKCKSQIDNLRFPILHFALCILQYRSFLSTALLATAHISCTVYCTSTLPILAISSLVPACNGFRPADAYARPVLTGCCAMCRRCKQ